MINVCSAAGVEHIHTATMSANPQIFILVGNHKIDLVAKGVFFKFSGFFIVVCTISAVFVKMRQAIQV